MTKSKHDYIKSLSLGSLYGVVGAIINATLGITVYGNMTFHLGEIVVILCLINCGFLPAFIASLLASLSLYTFQDNPYFFLLLGLEICFLQLTMKRGYILLIGDITYWLFVGMPLTYIIINSAATEFTYNSTLLVLKQIMNGILYVSFACILVPMTPSKLKLTQTTIQLPKLSTKIFEYLSITTTISTLITGLVLVDRAVKDNEYHLKLSLEHMANQTSAFIKNYINTHVNTVKNLASDITENPSLIQYPVKTINRIQARNTGFITMLSTNQLGVVTAGAPESFYKIMQQQPLESQTVASREYFQKAKETGKSFISQAFLGRGFGNDIIVAISSPYYVNNQFAGIVEGSMNLPKFADIEQDIDQQSGEYLLLLDQQNRIIYTSNSLQKKALDIFQYEIPKNSYAMTLPVIKLKQKNQSNDYFFIEKPSINHWRILVLQDTVLINSIVLNYYINLIILFSIITLLSLLFSKFLSKFLTKPLEVIVQDIFNHATSKKIPESLNFTIETFRVKERLDQAKQMFLDFQKELKSEVTKQTKQLSIANSRLEKLAQEDGLTGLLNRRVFDEVLQKELKKNSRQNIAMSLALIDIDHFKHINDTWGHPVGDQCIQLIAKLLKSKLKRDNDIVARVGGEEFAILFYTDNAKQTQQLMEKVRETIAQAKLLVDETEIFCTVSVGVIYLEPNSKIETKSLYSKVDQLLYQSKQNGRNRISFLQN